LGYGGVKMGLIICSIYNSSGLMENMTFFLSDNQLPHLLHTPLSKLSIIFVHPTILSKILKT